MTEDENNIDEDYYEEDYDDELVTSESDYASDNSISPEESYKQKRAQVKNQQDEMGTQALEKAGVPKPLGKTNGGFFSPQNSVANKAVKEKGTNTLTDAAMSQKENKPNSSQQSGNLNKFQQVLNQKNGGFPSSSNQNDANHLQQVLNKKNNMMPSNNQNNEEEENEGIGKKLDKVGEQAVSQYGGKAITAMTGGAVSGPAADAIAKTVAKPVGKMLKYAILIQLLPLLTLVLIVMIVICAVSDDDDGSSSNSNLSVQNGAVCYYETKKGQISNVKIRLLKCHNGNPSGNYGDPVQSELIDFEDYILGVTYQEIGTGSSKEAIKAQAIAVRNYTLTRSNGSRIKEENGQTIIEMYACTNDQAYCDPKNGCHSNAAGGEHDTTIYSGTSGGSWSRGPLENESFEEAVKETIGQVALSPNNNIVGTNYCSPETNLFSEYGKQGLSAFEILKKVYDGTSKYQGSGCGNGTRPKIVSISSNCEQSSTDSDTTQNKASGFKGWKQCGESWSKITIGTSGKSICQIGCAATSVAIQIANSGTNISISKLDPGTFVETLNQKGGFSGGNIYWEKASLVAPKFKLIGRSNLSGTQEQKANQLKQYLNNNEYVVIGVHKDARGGIGHWVALDKVSGNTVSIFDPGSQSTKLFDRYPYTKTREIAIRRYKVS